MVTLTCPVCNKDYEVVRRYRSKRKYCSKACSGEAKKLLYKGRYYHFNKLDNEKEADICRLYKDELMPANTIAPLFDVCTATIVRVIRKYHIERTPSQAAYLRVKQHPDIVASVAAQKIGKFCGNKSVRYKNGSGMWTVNIFKRDGYTCQDCGLHEPEIIEAHHIISKKEAPEKQYDLDNGVTLCPNCHKRRHIQLTKNGTYRAKTYGDIWQLEQA